MATRHLIGWAKLRIYPIEVLKKKPSDKVCHYTVAEATQILLPQLEAANAIFQSQPSWI